MILTANKIEKEVEKGNITITPFNKNCLSFNFTYTTYPIYY